jgi:hypothetical protein
MFCSNEQMITKPDVLAVIIKHKLYIRSLNHITCRLKLLVMVNFFDDQLTSGGIMDPSFDEIKT